MDLPDELWGCAFAKLSITHRLCVIERVCKRFQALLRSDDLWKLPRLTYARAIARPEASKILHAVCTKRHVLQALVDQVADSTFILPGHGAEPLAGRTIPHNDYAIHVFKELCDTARLAPSAAVGPIASWQELAVVVEMRCTVEQGGPEGLPSSETRTWIVEAASEGGCGSIGPPRATIADFDVDTSDEAGLLPFGRQVDQSKKCFVVVWAVHRRTKAVALLHAAEPEGEAPEGMDSNYRKLLVRGEKDRQNGEMRASSNVPRRLENAPVIKVPDFFDGGQGYPPRVRRDDAALVSRVSLTPVFERTGCTGQELLLDPREGNLGDIAGADAVADSWWPCHIKVEVEVDGEASVVQAMPDLRLSSSPDTSTDEFQVWMQEYIAVWAAWARACALPLLAEDVLWIEPRDLRQLGNRDELAIRVQQFFSRVVGEAEPISDEEEEDEPAGVEEGEDEL